MPPKSAALYWCQNFKLDWRNIQFSAGSSVIRFLFQRVHYGFVVDKRLIVRAEGADKAVVDVFGKDVEIVAKSERKCIVVIPPDGKGFAHRIRKDGETIKVFARADALDHRYITVKTVKEPCLMVEVETGGKTEQGAAEPGERLYLPDGEAVILYKKDKGDSCFFGVASDDMDISAVKSANARGGNLEWAIKKVEGGVDISELM